MGKRRGGGLDSRVKPEGLENAIDLGIFIPLLGFGFQDFERVPYVGRCFVFCRHCVLVLNILRATVMSGSGSVWKDVSRTRQSDESGMEDRQCRSWVSRTGNQCRQGL